MPISLREYWELLNKHDWYHEFSDDSFVSHFGRSAEHILEEMATTSLEHKLLFEHFREYVSSQITGLKKVAKPERP